MTRTVTRQHHGDRIVAIAVPTRDHRIYAPRRSRDSTLAAVPVGHILDQGIVWSGDLEGRAVRALDEVRQLSTPLTDPKIGGRKLEAEGTGPVLDFGRVYDGLSRAARGDQEGGIAQIESAVADAKRRKATDSLDWAERAVERGRQAQADAHAKMRAAADALWGTGATTDAAAPAVASGGRPTNEELNKLNAAFWADRAGK